ncbi:MAG: hypothetical protein KF833_00475 [Verrucomicrobiae bacterium]|nr:hypothetical protein [Verrucomicrobiae bacterium]
MHLIVVHHHLRPGGVRRVIEVALPHLMREWGSGGAGEGAGRVTVATGEAGDPDWVKGLETSMGGIPVRFWVDGVFRYRAEQRRSADGLRSRLRAVWGRLLGEAAGEVQRGGGRVVVWAHNLGLGRNFPMAQTLMAACDGMGIPLVAHHHDWWFDQRWRRWPEIRASGFGTLGAAAGAVFPGSPWVRHAAINRADASILRRHAGVRSGWLPNLVEPGDGPSRAAVGRARAWLDEAVGERAPVWLLPCRLLRRKNVAEAWLLTRWLRPEAWLVTTGGPSSADERPYWARLEAASKAGGWRVRLGVLSARGNGHPSIPELLGASEAVLLTSLQEGFGLPYVEGTAAGRPLVARSLPNVAPDLRRFGFRFPHGYREILIDPELFDADSERVRQKRLFEAWRRRLPASCRGWAEVPALVTGEAEGGAVAFSRLTLTAQLEVLARPAEVSWEAAVRWNPFLEEWRRRAGKGRLAVGGWPETAGRWLGGRSYARRFWRLAKGRVREGKEEATGAALQGEFIRERLSREYLYPLLWDLDS